MTEIILGENAKGKQLAILALCVFVYISLLFATISSGNRYYVLMLLVLAPVMIFFNWLYSKIFEIKIYSDKIVISNLYQRKELDINAFARITKSDLSFAFFPFPSPPYFVFHLRNNGRYIFIDSSARAMFSFFNTQKHIDHLTIKINTILKSDQISKR